MSHVDFWPANSPTPSYFQYDAPPKPVPPFFNWTRQDDTFVGECQTCRRVGFQLEDMRFEALASPDKDVNGWRLRVVADGETIHLSEHGSRIAACRAADRALTRAIALRSTDIEPRKP